MIFVENIAGVCGAGAGCRRRRGEGIRTRTSSAALEGRLTAGEDRGEEVSGEEINAGEEDGRGDEEDGDRGLDPISPAEVHSGGGVGVGAGCSVA